MNFTVSLSGTVTARVEASDLGLSGDSITAGDLGLPYSADISDVSISGEVDVSAFIGSYEHEVPASDMVDFDANSALNEALGFNFSIENAEFEVTDGPPGYDVVEQALGYDAEQAIKVYAALASNGYDVI